MKTLWGDKAQSVTDCAERAKVTFPRYCNCLLHIHLDEDRCALSWVPQEFHGIEQGRVALWFKDPYRHRDICNRSENDESIRILMQPYLA